MRTKSCFVAVLLCLFLLSDLVSASAIVSVTIHRIQQLDPIEGTGEGEADWYFHVGLWDENYEWQSSETDTGYEIYPNETFTFTTNSLQPYIFVMLNEEDTVSLDDLADVSSDDAGGRDDVASYIGHTIGDGVFESQYYLDSNQFSGDVVKKDGSYYKISGEFDDNSQDENDANMWFQISDNYEPPTANAGSDKNSKVGDLVNFNGIGIASAGSTIVRYQWDFNNDGVFDSEGQTSSYTYSTAGTYIVKLKVTDDYGKEATDTMNIIVETISPIAGFVYSPTSLYTSDSVTFTDTSTDQDGTISSWLWDFGDGDISKEKNPIHKYKNNGKYTVLLKVTDNDGASTTESKVITIKNITPNADFSFFPSNPSTSDEIEFADTSTDQDGTISSWLWDFGDSYTSATKNPSHRFEHEKTYSVTLTITDDDGASDSKTKTITVGKSEPSKPATTKVPNPTAVEPPAIAKAQKKESSKPTPGFCIFFGTISILIVVLIRKKIN